MLLSLLLKNHSMNEGKSMVIPWGNKVPNWKMIVVLDNCMSWYCHGTSVTKPFDHLLLTRLMGSFRLRLPSSQHQDHQKYPEEGFMLTLLPTLFSITSYMLCTAKISISEILWCIPSYHPTRTTIQWSLVIDPDVKPVNSLTALNYLWF